MRRAAQPLLSANGQLALEQYRQVLQHLEDLSAVTVRNYLSDLRQFSAWCEYSWHEEQESHFFIPQAVVPTLLMRCHDSLDTTMLSICGPRQDLHQDVEKIAWM